MSFKLSDDAYIYLKKIKKNKTAGEFKLDFDFYYLCAILGMTFRRCTSFTGGNEILRSFPNKYSKYSHIIIALLIEAEKDRTGVDSSDRKHFEKFILKFVDPKSLTELSDEGEDRLNCYAQGGFEKLNEDIGYVEPLDAFLVKYYELFSQLKDDNI